MVCQHNSFNSNKSVQRYPIHRQTGPRHYDRKSPYGDRNPGRPKRVPFEWIAASMIFSGLAFCILPVLMGLIALACANRVRHIKKIPGMVLMILSAACTVLSLVL